ncbi:MAG: xanthine dehydrogenase family protein molybdopterin-binding subunit [Candidatus Binatia bacterium]
MNVGRAASRVDGLEKVTGQAKFTGDLVIPGLLEGKVLRSPYPYARIKSIDARQAERMPGVVAVLTRDDLRDINPYYGHCLRDRPLIALDRVLYVGEPVAVVAAVDARTAAEAVSLIQVDYQERPPLATVDDALAPGATILHQEVFGVGEFHEMKGVGDTAKTNICHHEHFEKGDVLKGFAEADEIIEESYEFPMIYHYSMEPHTAVARFTGDGITLWTSSAHPFLVRSELAHMFGFSLAQVEVIVPYVGGAFGGKSYFKIEPLVVALARKTGGRPVRVAQSVSESMLTIRRHSARCRIKTGFKMDGTLLAREAEVVMDTGAYADNGPRVAKRAASRVHGPYKIEHCNVDIFAVYTNTVPAGSMRSIGGPQTIWPLECHMDSIAMRLGVDPCEFRMKNLLHHGEELRAGARPMDADLRMGLKKAADGIGWGKDAKRLGRALGLAIGVSDSEAMPVSVAMVRLLADGSVILMAGSTEVGQGARTVLSQIVAEELQLPLERVTMKGTNTTTTPFDRSTGASRSTTVMGNAVKAAALDLRQQLIEAGTEWFKVDKSKVSIKNGEVVGGEKRMSYGQLICAFYGMSGGELIGRGYIRPGSGMDSRLPVFWETGMGAADVGIDMDTGEVRLHRYVSIADVGKAINPRQCEAQDEGAAIQGLGHTLFESLQYENGQPLNPSLIDYRVPCMNDLPAIFESRLVENQDGPGPYGAKGMGESGIVSIAPAVGNAIFHATGVRIRELPLTPERVWRALKDSAEITVDDKLGGNG